MSCLLRGNIIVKFHSGAANTLVLCLLIHYWCLFPKCCSRVSLQNSSMWSKLLMEAFRLCFHHQPLTPSRNLHLFVYYWRKPAVTATLNWLSLLPIRIPPLRINSTPAKPLVEPPNPPLALRFIYLWKCLEYEMMLRLNRAVLSAFQIYSTTLEHNIPQKLEWYTE